MCKDKTIFFTSYISQYRQKAIIAQIFACGYLSVCLNKNQTEGETWYQNILLLYIVIIPTRINEQGQNIWENE